MPEVAIDVVLAIGLVAAAWWSLAARDVVAGAALFVVLGLLLAVTWARLEAPDVALAEAVLGAGFTGPVRPPGPGAARRRGAPPR